MVENGSMDHYFPQWLMRNWCDELNEIWCFDKASQRVKKKGTKHFGRERDLNKSDVIGLDLESTIFADLDNRFGAHTNALLLYSLYGNTKRVPNEIMRFFVELCLWTSTRNKSVQGWTDVDEFRAGVDRDHILHAWTDAELRKAIHLQFCKICHDEGVLAREADRLMKDFYFFFVVSDNKFITSDMPVQEFGTEAAEGLLGCEPVAEGECSLILFPVDSSAMFVATQHREFEECHRQFVTDDSLVHANYHLHINSDASELYFPYPIYEPRNLPADSTIADSIRRKVSGVPCAVDLDQRREEGTACIVYSNWSGAP
jgi:hypothetical protein